jgi:hypothetical protein
MLTRKHQIGHNCSVTLGTTDRPESDWKEDGHTTVPIDDG